ncbi:DNA primase [Treponema peruense]|uniref:DNA primase n=1 Tax=Treponema peruense TaxID=2787628 RepID=A0A7T3RFM3_9SPIR|nr:DNA primase [Treponema peruense]QQA02164.1 DNA primase [Treponema peruense]
MASFITQESIDEVSDKTDIVRVVGEYVPLVQKGGDWWGCCPFHNEKTPSFSVSSSKKFYYCFGCHASGTVFNFIMNMEKLSYPESVEFLAKRAGVRLSYTDGGSETQRTDPNAKLKDEYKNLYTRVAGSFHYMLTQTEGGKFALDYICKRGITAETIEKFKLGYSPADRKWLRKFLESKNYTKDFLDNSGLFSKKYPEFAFFSDRLMFPIFDRKGDVVAMGGRFLRGDASKSPKYLNSGDLIQYHKGETLYAFNFARQAVREKKAVIFCEGYMDCIAYHQCGIEWAVAPLGTALTEEQVRMVKPFVETVYLSFDADGAGQNATKRAILMCRRMDITVKVIRLHGGKDPAEIMLNFGADYLTNDVNNAIIDNDYLLSKLQEMFPKDTPEGKTKASLAFFAYIDALQSDVQKQACLDQLCQVYGIEKEAVRKDYGNREQLSRRYKKMTEQQTEPSEKQPVKVDAELKAVITAVADNVSLFQNMRNEISADDLDNPDAKELFKIMEECLDGGNFSVSAILNRIGSDELKALVIEATNIYSNCAELSVSDSIKLLKFHAMEKRRARVLERISELSKSALSEDVAQLNEAIQLKMQLDNDIKNIKDR